MNHRKEKESKEIDLKQKIDFLSNSVQEYEVFYFKKDLKEKIEYLCTVLNLLTLATNNKIFYKSFAIKVNIEQNRSNKLAKSFINALNYLVLQRESTSLSYAAGNFLRRLTKFTNEGPDLRAESLNKNLLVSSKCDTEFAKECYKYLSEICLASDRDNVGHLLKTNCIRINTILSLFVNVVFDRKESSTPEDFFLLFKWLSSTLSFSIFKILSLSESLEVIYQVSILMTSVL